MYNSLETRAPLLDQHLAEYVASLPSAVRTPNGAQKHLLKQAASGCCPQRFSRGPGLWHSAETLVSRRDESVSARELLDSPQAHERGVFEPKFVHELLHQHASTKRSSTAACSGQCSSSSSGFRPYGPCTYSGAAKVSSTRSEA